MRRLSRIVAVAAGAALAAGATGSLAASPGQADLQGAWVTDGVACSSVFASGKKGPRFKSPVDVFAPAFIIDGKTLRTPSANCRIGGVSADGERSKLSLSCTNTVSSGGVSAIFSMDKDGRIRRYFDETDQTGTAYVACK
jgi:hypothetical protein